MGSLSHADVLLPLSQASGGSRWRRHRWAFRTSAQSSSQEPPCFPVATLQAQEMEQTPWLCWEGRAGSHLRGCACTSGGLAPEKGRSGNAAHADSQHSAGWPDHDRLSDRVAEWKGMQEEKEQSERRLALMVFLPGVLPLALLDATPDLPGPPRNRRSETLGCSSYPPICAS